MERSANAWFFEEPQEEAGAAEHPASRQSIMEELSKKVQYLNEDTFTTLYNRIDRLFHEHLLTRFEALRKNMVQHIETRVEIAVADAIQEHQKKEEEVTKDLKRSMEMAFYNVDQLRNELEKMDTITKGYLGRFSNLWQEVTAVKEQQTKLREELKEKQDTLFDALFARVDGVEKYAQDQLHDQDIYIEEQIGQIRVQALEERKNVSKLLEEVFILPAKHKSELGNLARRSMAEDVFQNQQKNNSNQQQQQQQQQRLPLPFPSKTVAPPGPSKFDEIEKRLNTLDSSIGDLRHDQLHLKNKFIGIEEDLDFLVGIVEDEKEDEYIYVSEEEEEEEPEQENSETETEGQSIAN